LLGVKIVTERIQRNPAANFMKSLTSDLSLERAASEVSILKSFMVNLGTDDVNHNCFLESKQFLKRLFDVLERLKLWTKFTVQGCRSECFNSV